MLAINILMLTNMQNHIPYNIEKAIEGSVNNKVHYVILCKHDVINILIYTVLNSP
jgi:hypothetical protein